MKNVQNYSLKVFLIFFKMSPGFPGLISILHDFLSPQIFKKLTPKTFLRMKDRIYKILLKISQDLLRIFTFFLQNIPMIFWLKFFSILHNFFSMFFLTFSKISQNITTVSWHIPRIFLKKLAQHFRKSFYILSQNILITSCDF